MALITIPTDFGSGGKGLSPSGSHGTPALKDILSELQTHVTTLELSGTTTAGTSCTHYVKAASLVNLTLSGTQTIDSIACVVGDRVAAFGQTTGSENGIWIVAAGAWTRATDFDESTEVFTGAQVLVQQGTIAAKTLWELTTTGAITVGTTSIVFACVATITVIRNTTSGASLASEIVAFENASPAGLTYLCATFGGTRVAALNWASNGQTALHSPVAFTVYLSLDTSVPGLQITSNGGFNPVCLNENKGSDVATASVLSVPGGLVGGTGNYHHITGAGTVNQIAFTNGSTWAWADGAYMELYFVAATTLAHNAASPPANSHSIKCPSATNLVLTAGSIVRFRRDNALSFWVVASHELG